jgi:hypothetical protein
MAVFNDQLIRTLLQAAGPAGSAFASRTAA